MLFPTTNFLLFFLVVLGLVTALTGRHRAQKSVLLVASYLFYASWDWRFCFLLAGSSVWNYLAGRAIAANPEHRRAKWILGLAITGDLGLLGYFKYADFFVTSFNALMLRMGVAHELPFADVILPIGISFFTFHGISYVVDVYRGDVKVCRRLDDLLLYISFFPQLVAGPIVRAAFFLPQLEQEPPPDRVPIEPALLLILGGMLKKVVFANALATQLVDPVFGDPGSFGAADLLLAAYGYAVQIYCDFSAYTDIAIGVAALLGYRFPRNFDQPYRSARLSEFWTRWHISLSSWLRDYLYIPLGGNRKGRVRTLINLMVTMLLGGLWHGAAWKFVAWGGLHGGGLAVERLIEKLIGKRPGSLPGRILSTMIVFHLVVLAWVFFRADSFATAWSYLEGLQHRTPITQATPLTVGLIVAGLGLHFLPPDWVSAVSDRIKPMPVWAKGAVAGVALAIIDAIGPEGVAPFIYFQF